jgi:hypothetical protein
MKYMMSLAGMSMAALVAGCGGGGIATRSAGNISIHAGDNAVVTISDATATQEAQKSIDAGKVNANAAASNTQAQGGSASGGSATANPVVTPPPAPPAPPPAE